MMQLEMSAAQADRDYIEPAKVFAGNLPFLQRQSEQLSEYMNDPSISEMIFSLLLQLNGRVVDDSGEPLDEARLWLDEAGMAGKYFDSLQVDARWGGEWLPAMVMTPSYCKKTGTPSLQYSSCPHIIQLTRPPFHPPPPWLPSDRRRQRRLCLISWDGAGERESGKQLLARPLGGPWDLSRISADS